jgi:Domain of unknown function DUF29
MYGRSHQVAPKATPDLQFVVRTFDPAGDRAFSHVFREGAADSRFATWGQVRVIAVRRGQVMSDSKAGGASIRRPAAPSGRSATTSYDKDVILWSQEQARLLRAGRFTELDVEHLADEIEDVGKSEKRELASRMAVLLAHLLKWRSQPETRSKSWRATIVVQRKRIVLALKETPSLKSVMRNRDWQEGVWLDAITQAQKETGLAEHELPEAWPWTMDQAADQDFWPE